MTFDLDVEATVAHPQIRARPAGFAADVVSIAGRSLRQLRREPTSMLFVTFVPAFCYVVFVGALQDVARRETGIDYKAFELPVAVIFAVTGISRAGAVVRDIQSGYLDRLCVSPARRLALLLGLMVADLALLVGVTSLLVGFGVAAGVRFATGPAGAVAFVLLGAAWGVSYSGIPYAVAFRTGNPMAIAASVNLAFPFIFLTTTFLPKQALTGWLAEVATYNPVTYVLDAMRSLLGDGSWDAVVIAKGILAVLGMAALTLPAALTTFRHRTSRGG
jgi:ABC-2 type transport system permease protein